MKKLMMILALLALPFAGYSQKNNNKKDINMTTINKLEFHNLPYSYDALEPYIDKMTMEIHHSKHHKAYYDNMMNAVKGTEMENKSLEEVFSNMSKYPAAIRNNGGGYYNHNLYWEVMKVNGGKPSAKLEDAIVKTFGSMDELKKQFTDAGKTRFGSGWAWLSVDKDGKLFVSSTPNQDNPLMDVAEKHGTPILGMDVWEHAYYLKFQNKRPDYTEAFWSVINWEAVSKKYEFIVK
ncbi:MAG: superoxide dismutase [Bacteroidales bacterium]|jgi:Fe-Mn family superoxide dismutase|nr:superoxide dismutase [Bacteroidales bacterium]